MKITLDDWLEIEAKTNAAAKELKELSDLLTEKFCRYHEAKNASEAALLMKIEKRVAEAHFDLSPSLAHIQAEWTGGDSSNPRNHTLREPNWVHMGRRFPPEDVDKYRNESGDIVLPTRGNPSS